MSAAKIRVTQYTVNAHPEPESLDGSVFDLTVEYRGDDMWAVLRGRQCLSARGVWDWEPQPSERDDDWLRDHRFTEMTALKLAEKWAPRLKVNGTTPLDALAERRVTP